jgi:hypothetical protein
MRKNSELEQALQLANGRVEMLREALEEVVDSGLLVGVYEIHERLNRKVKAALSNLNEDSADKSDV